MYLPSGHSANIWNVFLKIMEVGFLTYENREKLSFRHFFYYFSYFCQYPCKYQLHYDIFGSKRVKTLSGRTLTGINIALSAIFDKIII